MAARWILSSVTVTIRNMSPHDECMLSCLQILSNWHRLTTNIVYFYINSNKNIINTYTHTAYEQAVIGMIAPTPTYPIIYGNIILDLHPLCKKSNCGVIKQGLGVQYLSHQTPMIPPLKHRHKKSPIFCKKRIIYKISILQKKQEGGSFLHMTNNLKDRMSPTYLGYPWRQSCHLPTYHGGQVVEWFATCSPI